MVSGMLCHQFPDGDHAGAPDRGNPVCGRQSDEGADGKISEDGQRYRE